jgi:hypothetical protein
MTPTDRNEALEFATMDDDERKRFAQDPTAGGQPGQPRELAFDDPRDPDRLGADPQPDSDEAKVQQEDQMAESGAIEEGTRRQPPRRK